jgi:hypothetical protein
MQSGPKELQAIALRGFKEKKDHFVLLKKEYFNEVTIYSFDDQPKRKFIGELLKKIFEASNIKHRGSAQRLFARSQKFKKK